MTHPPHAPPSTDLSLEEYKALRALQRAVDDLLEESLRERENLTQSFRRCFPPILALTGARAVALTTRDEDLRVQTWCEGDWGEDFPGPLLEGPSGVRRLGEATLVTQPLDVAGDRVGSFGLLFTGDHASPEASARVLRLLDTIAEQLDTVLCMVHTASEKHQLIIQCNAHLANPVFEVGMDQAVLTLAQRVRLPTFLLLYRDAVRAQVLHYRMYRHGHLEFESGEQPSPDLEKALRQHGHRLLAAEVSALRQLLPGRTTEAVLISGAATSEPLGKIAVSCDEGFSAYAMDLIRVLASTLSQRLLDYNRERIHLSQFFPNAIIDALLQDPNYAQHLRAQDQEVGILFADINGFTRICEHGFDSPRSIARFVDEWSARAVDCIWEHGGVFDKMVGDCVIGLFGPPFFKSSRVERSQAAVRAACDIQALTAALGAREEVMALCERVKLPGLGVAVGVNLANANCGLFGPNRQYTAFSSGMNQAARLQSLAGFRETLVMASAREALVGSREPFVQRLRFGALAETPVKNVAQPLRHYRLEPLTP
ncbi:adenylate/guanylate cyclase domain-containing protein [Myxococcus llanfairpwllgwyngyllgogerychwyrndrobwllllantysiliogogogochensis]|uniref:Adenylate/guanylate cyclase domain-containing protein n=1 Tax=Myxococcus llanfairpwllgwyngyllgogerychwyrndrobwllllantysiliogogogochensis TaxID=2590453 RepID=A0A540X5B6_9BACT|nr:adenylate/guanylate cyclase domain-containing protein [Myxococcus llanfairpwllgwyngyllgogerychwyrndrobwllllantysiliogogogochensis]TQF16419.1 adenylate/guanylate cyclase domain-containing protein [Myxococcus llanfairpwllgwyngyllgogerychwyrndrobwllllantysiliogogogochensis]